MNMKKIDYQKMGTYLFYIAIALETLFVLLDKSEYILQQETWDFRFTFLLLACKIATTKYSVKEWAALIGFTGIGIVSFLVTDREEIVRIVGLMAACKDVAPQKIGKLVFWETLIGSVIIAFLSLMGVYGTVSLTAFFRGGGIEETRYCLGMGHPNALHCMFLVIMILGLAVYDRYMKWYSYTGAFILNFLLYLLTDSRTSVAITTVAILLAAFIHYAGVWKDRKVVYILGISMLAACVVFSIFIAVVGVEIPVLRTIDDYINGRFQWAKSEGGIQFWSLFSNEANQNFMDMAYVRLFYWYGIFPAVVYLILLGIGIWKCREKRAYDCFVIIMTFVMYSMIEAHAVSVYIGRNYVFFYLWTLCFAKSDTEYDLCDIGRIGVKQWKRIFK